MTTREMDQLHAVEGASEQMSSVVHADFAERARPDRRRPGVEVQPHYDFIVCGSGSSGSVVARRLAENADVSVLLLEAGGDDDVPDVTNANRWPLNLGGQRDWGFQAEPNPHLHGRSIPLSMGKVLGGGSSINAMIWARGHQQDWDFFAAEAGDPAWSYASVLNIYRRIEDWRGIPDPAYRGTDGPIFVQPAPDPNPLTLAMLEGARSIGIPTFESQNGRMMEGHGGASLTDVRVRNGKRTSVFRSYVAPVLDRPNLTVLTQAVVTRLTFDGRRATGVEIGYAGNTHRIRAAREVVLSLGAMNTPKVLMQSGIGDQAEVQRVGIPLVQHLPGVGQSFQDHPAIGCVWESHQVLPSRNNRSEATVFWRSDAELAGPDLQICLAEHPLSTPQNAARFGLPAHGWTLFGCVVRPESRGRIRLTGPDPSDPIRIDAGFLSHPGDLKAAKTCVELCLEIGNSAALRPFARREVMPGALRGAELETFVREGVQGFWHSSGTARMGRDAMSVVDGSLKVYGVDGLRIADASIVPRVTTGNTMAPCVVIGERAAEILRTEHRL
jgi:choline dehydrogenase